MSSTINASVDGIVLTASSTAAMDLATGGTNRLSIDTSGNVGIATGNLTFSGTGQRITGDFTNSTASSRLLLQSSTTNGLTSVGIIPNGTSTTSALVVNNASDASNASFLQLLAVAAETRINSSYVGTGSYLPLAFYTGGSERMRLDTSGNLGIGNTAPSYKLQVNNASASATADAITVQNSGVASNGHAAGIRFRYVSAEPAAIRAILTNDQTGAGSLAFFTSSDGTGANLTERMRITSGGNVGINTTAPGNSRLRVQNSSGVFGNTDPIQSWSYANFQVTNLHLDGSVNPVFNTDADSNWNPPATMIWQFRGTERMRLTAGGELYIAGTTDQGAYNLQCNGTGVWGAGAYVNGSDARLKDNIQSLDSGLDVVKAMRPVTFQYKPEYSKDQNVQPGFIAQELQQAMAGKNYLDGVVQSGPEYLNVAYQNIIPILVKAIQELEAKVAALETK